MKRFDAKDIYRILYSLLLIAMPSILLAIFLRPQGPLAPLILFVILSNTLYFLKERTREVQSVFFTVLLYLVLAAGVVVVLIDVMITPYTAYLTWFKLVRDGDPRGAISYLVVMTMLYFCSIVAGGCYREDGVKPLLTIIFICGSVGFLVLQSVPIFLACLGVFALLLFLIASRGYRGWNILRAFGSSFTVLLCAVLFAFIFTGRAEPKGSRLIDMSLSPSLREFVINVFPDFPILYGIPGYGYSFESRGLGKSPVLSQRSIFEIDGNPGKNIYLRTSIYNIYQEDTWAISPEILEKSRKYPDVQFSPPRSGNYTDEFDVTVLSDFYSMIPHTLETSALDIHRRKSNAVQYGSLNTGYLLEQPLLSGETVSVYETGNAAQAYSLQDRELYLEYPDSISSSVRDLARSLDRQDPLSTAASIRSYLADRYAYTLNTDLPKGKELIEYFLFGSKQGYCVHFASTFVILARLDGIPSRYVTGFLSRIPPDQSSTRISGYSAHAWPEIWVPGKGWIIIEATPPVQYSEGDGEYPGYYRSMEDEYTARQLRELIGSRNLPAADRELNGTVVGTGNGFVANAPVLIAIILGIIVAVGALVLVFRVILKGDPLARIRILSGRTARRLEKAGIGHPSRIGWLRWGDEVERLQERVSSADGRTPDIRGFVDLVVRTFFGNHTPEKCDVDRVHSFMRSLNYRQLRTAGRLAKTGEKRRRP